MQWFAPRGRSHRLVLVLGAVAVFTNFQEGYSNAYPNTSIDTFKGFMNESYARRGTPLSEATFTWLWSAVLNIWFIGYLVGTLITPSCNERLGRRKSLLVANTISLVGTVLCTSSIPLKSPEVLIVARLVESLSSGLSFGSLILFAQEVTPTHLRGLTSFLSESAFIATIVVGMGLGMDALLGEHLVPLIGVGIPCALLSILVLLPLEDSPKFLLIKRGDREAALKALRFYHGESKENEAVLDEILLEAEQTEVKLPLHRAVVHVFSTPHLRSAYLIGVLSLQVIVGIWPIIYLSTDLLQDHFSTSISQLSSFIFILANFVASILGMFVVERFPRRVLLIGCGLLNTLFLLFYVAFDRLIEVKADLKYGLVVSIVLYGCSYGAALGPIAFFITSELVAQESRSLVQSLVYATSTTVNFAFSFVTLPVYKIVGVWGFLVLFTLPSSLSLLFLYFHLPETKGREVHDIVDELMGRHSKRQQASSFSETSSSSNEETSSTRFKDLSLY